ncbi:hypothetical protein EU95_1348 [Prochlorococcus marinus str. MIT 9201]|uniref:Uncharacterized protein n=1 Tax=Prochlorococcus marinus str. MIT 9201 TaxID=93057 RepID=A0A0A2A252_PROMR|nr:hypothetical protein [Prochlorococcus marinus]KGF95655.1 hypothetical protein EU95_1348 [Prochlorococcus marinus str. MIT 9201]
MFNKERKNLITPEKAASFIPVFISSGISILLIVFFVIPQYFKSNEVNFELNGLIKKKNELDNLKSQYKIINNKFEKLNKEKTKIIELITGRSNLDTLLAELGKLGRKNNIEFLSIAPQEVVIADENNTQEQLSTNSNQTDLENDPLLVEGVKKYLIDFTFNTDFVNLLSFLRDLEYRDNAVLLDNITLSLNYQDNDDGVIKKTSKMLEVNLRTIFYGKN